MSELSLRQIRLAKEISVKEMAEFLEIHPNTYALWEAEPSKISIEQCYKICQKLGVEYSKSIFLP